VAAIKHRRCGPSAAGGGRTVSAITALVAVRPTFHASIQEAMRQTLGLVLGAVVATLPSPIVLMRSRTCSPRSGR
jgi:hypothetical protein